MTAREMNDWYYSTRCVGCDCLWFHEQHAAGCPTKARIDILMGMIENIEMQVNPPWIGPRKLTEPTQTLTN